jgi:UDP-N-acetylmuramate dehydrogenase
LLFGGNAVYYKIGRVWAIMVTAEFKSDLPTYNQEVYKKAYEALGKKLKQNVTLAPYTTFRIGGKAQLFFLAEKPEELIFAIRTVQKLSLRFFVLGGGSNILVSDSGFKGLVIKNECRQVRTYENKVTCQSGALLTDLVELTCQRSLSGLEFAAGIPGTVGGAVRGNAGAFGESIGGILENAVVLDHNGEIKEGNKDFFQFGYRQSRLKQSGEILLSATFRLKEQKREEIAKRVQGNLRKREERLPWREKSAGCFFKNIDQSETKISAGLLLDRIGAKGMREGGAEVSTRHANFLINSGNAKADDIIRLALRLKSKVKEKFDIDLEEEVVYIK